MFRYHPPFAVGGGPALIIDRFLGFLPGSATVLRFEVEHGRWLAYGATLAAMGWLILRRAPLYASTACVLAVLFAFMNDSSLYHHLWIVPLGLLAGQRLFVAAVVLTHSIVYVSVGFIGGAMFFPGIDGPGTQWLRAHDYWVSALGWAVFVAWAATILYQYRSPATAPVPAQAAAASSSP